jgi:hypothetical protein
LEQFDLFRTSGLIFTFLLLAALPHAALASSDADTDEIKVFECSAKIQGVGREDPSLDSPLMRWPGGDLRILNQDDPGYLHEQTDDVRGPWITLYGVPGGHGNTLLGEFQTVNFDCKAIDWSN